MVLDLLDPDGRKGSNANMEGDPCEVDPSGLDRLEKGMGEMEPRSRSSDGSIFFRQDGLITLPVLRFIRSPDVRGKGNMTELLKKIHDLSPGSEPNLRLPPLHFQNIPRKILPKLDPGSRSDLFRILDQSFPFSWRSIPRGYEKDFALSSSLFLPDEPGWEDPSIIHHDEVPRAQEIGQILEGSMLNLPRVPVDHHQTRVTPFGRRVLGDQRRGKVKIELFNSHREKHSLMSRLK
jgi:hypothetical protein